jgi:MFS superfamily sulfate permease-like transporter
VINYNYINFILQAGPVFTPIPKSVLGTIVLWSSIYLCSSQFLHIPLFLETSLEYFLIWLGTFVTILLMDIPHGLVVGSILSLRLLLFSIHPDFNKRNKTEEESV